MKTSLLWRACALALALAAPVAADEAFLKARTLYLKGSYDEAEPALRSLSDAGDVEAGMTLVRLLLETGRSARARGLAADVVAKNPKRADAAVLLAEIELARGAVTEAEDLLKSALTIDPDSRRARVYFKRIYDLTGRRKDSERMVDYFWDFNNKTLVYQREPDPADFAYVAEVVKGYDATATKVAFRHYRRAYGRDPDLYEAYIGAGDLATEVFDWDRAKKAYEGVLARNPKYAAGHLGLARLYLAASKNKEAEAAAKAALDVNRELSGARVVLAQLHLVDDRTEEARLQIDAARDATPNAPEVLAIDATWHFATGDKKAYRAAVRKTLDLYPNDTSVYISVAGVLERRRRFPEALSQYRKAIELDNGDWEGHFGAGMTLVRMGEETAGYKELEISFEQNPFNVWAYNTLVALDGDFKEGKLARRETEHFVVKMSRTEVDVLGEHIDEVVERIWDEETKRFGYAPRGPDETKRKVLFEMFADHEDFSSRTTGMPNLGALGATLGQIVTMPSPSWGMGQGKPFRWVAVFRHEFAHVITLQLTDYRIPRWFTEGISVFVEKDPQAHYDGLMARRAGERQIPTIEKLNSLFTRPEKPSDVALGYYQAALIVEYLVDEFGFGVIMRACELYKEGHPNAEVFKRSTGLLIDELDRRVAAYITAHLERVHAWAPPGPKEMQRLRDRLAANAGDAAARARLAEGFIGAAKYDEALVQAERAVKDSGGANAVALVALGLAHKMTGADALALDSFKRAAAVDPGSFHAHLYLGLALWNRGENEAAASALEKAHEINPRFVREVHAFRAPPYVGVLRKLLVDMGATRRARLVAERAAETDPNDADSATFAGRIALDEGRLDAAAKWLERALSINPFDASSQKMFARTEMTLAERSDRQTHLKRAARAYRAATALADRDAEAFGGLARALDAIGRGEEARAAVERLRQFDAGAAQALEAELQ